MCATEERRSAQFDSLGSIVEPRHDEFAGNGNDAKARRTETRWDNMSDDIVSVRRIVVFNPSRVLAQISARCDGVESKSNRLLTTEAGGT